MMGGANKASAAMTAAPLSGTRRIGAGTIGEAAAIARRAAMGEERGPVADTTTDPFPESADGKRRAAPLPNSTESLSKTIEPSEVAPEPGLVRHSKAGAGQLKGDTQDGSFERTAAYLILADRAYAYGRRIVTKEKASKIGDLLAIES